MRVQFLGWKGCLEEEMEPTTVFLPRESHGARSLLGYSPLDPKESNTTERLSTHTSKKAFQIGTSTKLRK